MELIQCYIERHQPTNTPFNNKKNRKSNRQLAILKSENHTFELSCSNIEVHRQYTSDSQWSVPLFVNRATESTLTLTVLNGSLPADFVLESPLRITIKGYEEQYGFEADGVIAHCDNPSIYVKDDPVELKMKFSLREMGYADV